MRWLTRLALGLAVIVGPAGGGRAGPASEPRRDLFRVQASVENAPIDRLPLVVPALRACWRLPSALARMERLDVTARFGLRTDGSLIGDPAITFATGSMAPRARELLTRSVLEAIRACTPLRMSPGLAHSIAGRPLSIRFIYIGRQGQGV